MIAALKHKSERFFLVSSVSALLVVSLGSAGLVGLATGMFTPAGATELIAIAPPKVIDVKNVPMALAMDATISKPGAEWDRRDETKKFTLPPFPFSCASTVVNPSYSVTQKFNTAAPFTFTSNGYTAGLGAAAFKENIDKSDRCVGTKAAVSTSPVEGLGTEAVLVVSRRGSLASQSVVWRRGDIVSYVNSDAGNPVDFALAIDKSLSGNIAGQCINEASTIDDVKRTVWGGSYDGFKVQENVSIPETPLPKISTASNKEDYEITPIPSGKTAVVKVDTPATPSYPVWPKLPTEVTFPKLPDAPAAKASTQKAVTLTKEDVDGPGCGWNFTGTVRPVFDPEATESANDTIKVNAVTALSKEASEWKDKVLKYWKDTKTYTTQAKPYEEYAKKINELTVAWDGIAHQWDTYNANTAIYEQSIDDNKAFLDSQKEAQKGYDGLIDQCKVQDARLKNLADEVKPVPTPSATPTPTPDATIEPTPTPTPSASPSATPSATPSSTPPPVPTIQCPPVKPDILSQEAPKVLDKPQTPANPIPESER